MVMKDHTLHDTRSSIVVCDVCVCRDASGRSVEAVVRHGRCRLTPVQACPILPGRFRPSSVSSATAANLKTDRLEHSSGDIPEGIDARNAHVDSCLVRAAESYRMKQVCPSVQLIGCADSTQNEGWALWL